jgi:hypothetical protein
MSVQICFASPRAAGLRERVDDLDDVCCSPLNLLFGVDGGWPHALRASARRRR